MDLIDLTNNIGTVIAEITLAAAVIGTILYVAFWFIRELYYWAKYHLMGLFKENEWNQYRRR